MREEAGTTSGVPRALLLLPLLITVVLTPAAAAEPRSTSFTMTGSEYAFTFTVGSFAGRGAGNAGGTNPIYVNGGSFAMTVRPSSGGIDAVAGMFTHHGGTITTLKSGANCRNQ